MKILMVHNYYNSILPSGEKGVFEAEKALLKAHGHQVELFTRNNDEILARGLWGEFQAGLSTPWNFRAASAIRHKIDVFKPDVVHVHNTFPLISPSIFYEIGSKAARVLTLHNYRLFCPAAIPMRNGKVCTECLDQHSSWPSIMHGCYRNSRLSTVPLALSVALHRGLKTWTKQVDGFITLTEFQKEKMIAAGLPADKVYTKSNFYAGNPVSLSWAKRENYVVFVGRLASEKGIEVLIRAWELWGKEAPELRVIGGGPLEQKLKLQAKLFPVKFFGQLSPAQTQEQISTAKLLILPSKWFEGFPMVLAEAFAFGTPTAVSNIGSLPSIVKPGQNGIVFEPDNPISLMKEVRFAWETPDLLEKAGQGAREDFERKYNLESNYLTLMQIYKKAITQSKEMEVK